MSELSPTARRTRAHILEAACGVFVEKGLRAPTVKDVLAAAEVSRRTFYQYFGSMDELILAIYVDRTEKVLEQVAASIFAAEEPIQKVEQAVDVYLELQALGGPILFLLRASAISPDSPLRAHREGVLERLIAVLDVAVQGAIGKRVDPWLLRTLLAGIDGLVLHAQRQGSFDLATRARVRANMVALVAGVLGDTERLPPPPGEGDGS